MTKDDGRAPEHIIADLMQKCGADVSGAVLRSAMLVDHTSDRGVIATGGVSAAIGVVLKFFFFEHPQRTDMSVSEAVDTYWSILRPQVIIAVQKLQENHHG